MRLKAGSEVCVVRWQEVLWVQADSESSYLLLREKETNSYGVLTDLTQMLSYLMLHKSP